MAPFGTIYPLTVQFTDLNFPFIPFLVKDLAFRASTGGSRLIIQQTLEFAVTHGIKPMIEKFPLNLEGIKEALEKMQKGGMRYKAVLESSIAQK
jgi:D-arabinose 1-dehydrogenase-like Zn-dependent alcohol dehydrogenase